MRGKDNSNYMKTRDLCESMCNIFNLSRNVTHSFTRVLAEALVHKVAEEVLESDHKVKNVNIEIPFIGLMSISVNNSKIDNVSIELEDEFRSWIINAVDNGSSPLVKDAEESIIKRLVNRYNSLL